jgi:hypothetical protein
MSEEATEVTETATTEAGGDFFSAIESAFEFAENNEQNIQQEESVQESAEPTKEENLDDVPEIKEGTEAESTLPIDEEQQQKEEGNLDESADGLSGKAGRRFKQLKNELKQANTDLAQARQQMQEREQLLQELEARSKNNEEYEKTISDYEQTLSVTKLEATKAYKQEVQQPMINLVEAADQIAKRYDIDSDELIDVLSYNDREKQDDALDNLLQGVKERDKLAIYALAEQIPVILERKANLVENASAALAELEQIDAANRKQELAKQHESRHQAAQQVHDKLVSKVPFLKTIEDLDFSNVTKRAGDVDFDSLDIHNKVYSKIAGDMLPKLVREFSSLRSELEEALDELESYKKSSAKTGGGPSTGSSPSTAKSGSFIDRVNAAFGS